MAFKDSVLANFDEYLSSSTDYTPYIESVGTTLNHLLRGRFHVRGFVIANVICTNVRIVMSCRQPLLSWFQRLQRIE